VKTKQVGVYFIPGTKRRFTVEIESEVIDAASCAALDRKAKLRFGRYVRRIGSTLETNNDALLTFEP
jgi:hypothetical protein